MGEVAANLDASVLLIGEGPRTDALARGLLGVGLEVERVCADRATQVALVTTPDLVVFAGASDRAREALAALACEPMTLQLPVLVFHGSSPDPGCAALHPQAVELAFDGGPALCAQRVRALIRSLQEGTQGRPLQQMLDEIVEAQPRGAARASHVSHTRCRALPGLSKAPDGSGTRASSRRRPQPVAGWERASIPISALTAASDGPVAVNMSPARRPTPAGTTAADATSATPDREPRHPSRVNATSPADRTEARTDGTEGQPSLQTTSTSAPQPDPHAPAAALVASEAPAYQDVPGLRRMPRMALVLTLLFLAGSALALHMLLSDARSEGAPASGSGSLAHATLGADAPLQADSPTPVAGPVRAPDQGQVTDEPSPLEHRRASAALRKRQVALAKHHVSTGHALLKRNKLRAARAAYGRALLTRPAYPQALAGIVRVQLLRKNGPAAVRWAKRLVHVQPKSGHGQLLLGDAWAMRGNKRRALAAYRKAARYGDSTARQRLSHPPRRRPRR